MQPLTSEEILSKEEYERMRPGLRRHIIALKARRRVPVGDHATVHFETRETMRYQVHEMLRAEDSWRRRGAVEGELEAYNPLIPAGGELSATLMLEWETAEERAHHLRELRGLDRHLWLQVGDTEPVAAAFDDAQVSSDRISSVQYVKWPVDDERCRLLRTDGTVVRVILDHPHYGARAVLGEETRKEIATDLD
jgi:hypothetical protein